MLGRRRSGHSLVATLARLSFIQQTLFKSSVHCVTGTGIVLGGMMVNKTVLVIVEFRRVVEETDPETVHKQKISTDRY